MVDTQLIAHDKEVYDIAWGGVGVFASVSADGSVRVFDLRDKEHSTIIYESPQPETPLLRLGWNKQDPRYMATILMDSQKVVVLDIRFPTLPVAELSRHQVRTRRPCHPRPPLPPRRAWGFCERRLTGMVCRRRA